MRGSTLSLRKEDSKQELTLTCNSTSVLYYFEGNRMSNRETVLVSDDATTSNSEGTKHDAQQNTLPMTPKTPMPEPTKGTTENKTDLSKGTTKAKKKPQGIGINDAYDKYGHIGEAALHATLKSIGLKPTGTFLACSGCAQAKARAKNIPKFTSLKSTSPGERIYTDISGPYKKLLIGSNYWILFVDQYSGKAWSFFVLRKNMMAKVADKLFMQLKSAGYTLPFLRCDNTGKNVAGLSKVCKTHGIKEEFTAPHTPQQNGVVECKFVTIQDRACAAMYAAKLSDEYHGLLWAESVHTHTQLTNLVENSATNKCPDWLFYSKQPTLYPHLVQFGCIGWVTICTKIPKLTPKAIKCIMLRYSHNHAVDTYRMYNITTKKLIDSRNVRWADWHGNAKITADIPEYTTDPESHGIVEVFDEVVSDNATPSAFAPSAVPPATPTSATPGTPASATTPQVTFASPEAGGNDTGMNTSRPTKITRELQNLATEFVTSPTLVGARASTWQLSALRSLALDNKAPPATTNNEAYTTSLASDPFEPKSYKAALTSNESDQWNGSIKKEIDNFYKCKVWKCYPRKELNS